MNDTGTYTVDGDKLIYSPFSGGQNRYLWRMDSDRLMLEFVGSTEDPYAGLPAEVYQRAFYTEPGARPCRAGRQSQLMQHARDGDQPKQN